MRSELLLDPELSGSIYNPKRLTRARLCTRTLSIYFSAPGSPLSTRCMMVLQIVVN